MSTHCGCPGPNTIAREGMCPSCGFEGPDHQRALLRAVASRGAEAAREHGRAEGLWRGYQLGIERGRNEIEAEREVEQRPFRAEHDDYELEAGEWRSKR
jgi:hypothetical protein